MHRRKLTYRFVRAAMRVGKFEAFEIGLYAGAYAMPVHGVRARLAPHQTTKWGAKLSGLLAHADDNDTVGRFEILFSPISWMRKNKSEWAREAARLARAKEVDEAVEIALEMEKNLSGAGTTELGQIMHLLHPTWFAIVNKYSESFWTTMKYEVGGVAALEEISAAYRKTLMKFGQDFNIIDELFSDR